MESSIHCTRRVLDGNVNLSEDKAKRSPRMISPISTSSVKGRHEVCNEVDCRYQVLALALPPRKGKMEGFKVTLRFILYDNEFRLRVASV